MRTELVEFLRKYHPEVPDDGLRRVAMLASDALAAGGHLGFDPQPLPRVVRVEATYPASDGSQPERIEVIWETGDPTVDVFNGVIGALARVPGARDAVQVVAVPPEWKPYPTAAELLDAVMAEPCDCGCEPGGLAGHVEAPQ